MDSDITSSINQPLVSVCVPAYDCAKYITETLACLCCQTHVNLEIIVVNDGSADETLTLAKSVEDTRVTVLDFENRGAATARNIAYKHSKGDYIIFFDADDCVAADFISSQLNALSRRTDCIAVSAWGRFYRSVQEDFKLNKELIDRPCTLEDWIVANWYSSQHNTPPGRLLIPRVIVERAGLWNESLSLNDDFEFFTRIALNAAKIIPNPEAVYCYRSGINGLSNTKSDEAYLSLFESMKLSFDLAIGKYGTNSEVRRACANQWQSYIYEVYPRLPEQHLKAQEAIKKLGGADFKYPAGGLTSLLIKFLGWKVAKNLKLILKR